MGDAPLERRHPLRLAAGALRKEQHDRPRLERARDRSERVAVRPAAVDVSGGVEAAPGRKDPILVERFIHAARSAAAAIAIEDVAGHG